MKGSVNIIFDNFLNKVFYFGKKVRSVISYDKKDDNKNIYFDNAAATKIDAEVLTEMNICEELYANPSAIYRNGVSVKNKIEESRKIISNILNCHAEEIIFTGTGTESVNAAIFGIVNNYYENKFKENSKEKYSDLNSPENKLRNENKKPIIVTSNIEHAAVLSPILHLENIGRIEKRILKVNEAGEVNVNELQKILEEEGGRVIMVTVMYANNEVGKVQRIKEMGRVIDEWNRNNVKKSEEAEKVKSELDVEENIDNELSEQNYVHQIIFHTDAMQAANYLDMDVRKMRVHMMSFNGSKIYGPKGVGVLYKNKSINISPIIFGGEQERGIRSGTEDVAKIVGIRKALEIATHKKEKEVIRLLELQKYFIEKLENNFDSNDIKIWTQQNEIEKIVNSKINKNTHKLENVKKEQNIAENKLEKEEEVKNKINYFNINTLPNNINIGLSGMQSDELVIRLDYAGFDVSHKSACAAEEISEGSYVLRALGATEKESNENIRITMGRDTNKSDIDKFVKSLKEIYFSYKK